MRRIVLYTPVGTFKGMWTDEDAYRTVSALVSNFKVAPRPVVDLVLDDASYIILPPDILLNTAIVVEQKD